MTSPHSPSSERPSAERWESQKKSGRNYIGDRAIPLPGADAGPVTLKERSGNPWFPLRRDCSDDRRFASGDRGILQSLGRTLRSVRDGRLAKTDADLVKALQVQIRQIGKTLPDVVNRFIDPVALIFLRGLKDPAAVDMTEQFVTGSIKEFLFGQITLRSRIG